MPLLEAHLFQPLVGGLDHPEDIVWGRDGRLYAGSESGQIYVIDVQGGVAEPFAHTQGFVLGMAVDGHNNLYVCDVGRKAVLRIDPQGKVTSYCADWDGQPMVSPNYPVFDASGQLYVSDSGKWWQDNGAVYRIAPDGKAHVFSAEAKRFPNGLALSPDGQFLYIAESNLPGVTRLPIRPDGTSGPLELVVELPRTVPDGLAFDRQGRLYISCYHPNCIYRYQPDGLLETLVDDWTGLYLTLPTNLAFGGDNLATLFVANLGGYHIAQCTALEVQGQPLHTPAFA